MRLMIRLAHGVMLCLLAATACTAATSQGVDWKNILLNRLPLYGHRNWIVVADSAYPAQTAPGIEVLYSDADQTEVLYYVFQMLAKSKHVTPNIFTDRELNFLREDDVPGITSYRNMLTSLAGDRKIETLLHADLISKLDQVSQSFRVLVIKTRMTMPYTSVFLQLDCAYWTPDQEKELRSLIRASK